MMSDVSCTPRARRIRGLLLFLAIVLGPLASARAVERSSLEVAIVYNILQFIEWPNEQGLASDASLVLCLKSTSPLYPGALGLGGRPVRRMTLRVVALESAEHRCQVVYLDSAQAEKASYDAGPQESMLIVGASGYRTIATPTIQLVAVEGRLAFDISQRKAAQAGLTVSSRLLKLAHRLSE
jgi:uncharacterized protein DUF4154